MPPTSPAKAPAQRKDAEPEIPSPPVPAADSRVRRAIRVLGLRRRFLVDHRFQLRAGFLIAGTVLILLVLLNVSLHAARQQATAAVVVEAPEVAPMLHAQNRLELMLVVAASLVFVAGVFVVTVLETHKTAGAAFNLERHLSAILNGHYGTRLRLRQDDNLRAVQQTFNAMSDALQQRASHDVEMLECLAERLESLAGPSEVSDLVAAVRAEAESKRHLAC
jgi:hypothetical protein